MVFKLRGRMVMCNMTHAHMDTIPLVNILTAVLYSAHPATPFLVVATLWCAIHLC